MNHLLLIFSFVVLNACGAGNQFNTMENMQVSIIEAVKNNQLTAVDALLKQGADVNRQDKNNKSLLLIATQANNLEMARLLVSQGANVNQQDDKKDSPFLYAGASGYLEFVKLFLANGARFDVFNRYNGTALIPACERGHLDVVQLLANTNDFPIDHVNRLGWTALMEAVVLGDGSKKYVAIVQALLDAGCNPAIPDNDGVTALQHARSRNYAKIVALLQRAK